MTEELLTSGGTHVAMVVRSFSVKGGLELYAHKVVEGLLAAGLRVTVICEEADSSFSHPRMTVVKFAPPPAGSPKRKRILHHLQAASRAVEEHGPFDLVHSQHLPITNADLVTFHNQTAPRLSRVGKPWEGRLNDLKIKLVPAYKLRHELDAKLCHSASCLIFPSAVCRDDFYETYGSAGELQSTPSVVAPPGADLATAATSGSAQEQAPAPSHPFTFLFVGRGYRKKGLDVLLKACRLLKDKGSDFRLIIAGLRAKPLDTLRLRLMGLAGRVSYLGFRQDMDAVYAQSHAFVMPSRLEPYGMAPLQAMQRGVPAIVSRVAGVAEDITDGESGLILQNHLSPDELAGLMGRLLDDPALCARLSGQARRVAATATWERTVAATLEAYRLALSGKHKALETSDI